MAFVTGMVAGLAAPALAGSFYSWTTEDGVRAYTDDAKRVPARYRARAELRETGSLEGFERYTPIQGSAVAADGAPAARAARPVESLPSVSAPPPAGGQGILLDTGDVSISLVGVDGGEPVVVEQIRTRVADSEATRTVQVVRQGDRVLAIIKPTPNQTNLDAPDESELLD